MIATSWSTMVGMLMHKKQGYDEHFAKDGSPPSPGNAGFVCILQLLRDSIPADKTKHPRLFATCKGVREERAQRA